MKKLSIIILLVCSIGYGQKTKHYASEKWITTAVDSFYFVSSGYVGTHLTVTLDSLPANLLKFSTDIEKGWGGISDSSWRTLLPTDASYTYPFTIGHYLYRRAVKDSVYSRAWAD